MDPFVARAAVQPIPSGHITSVHWTGKDGARVRVNVAIYHKKEN